MQYTDLPQNYEIHIIKTAFYNFFNYCYIIMDKKSGLAMVVDPAWEIEKISNKLNQLNASLIGVLITHSHYDHVNLVTPLIKKYNAKIYMAKVESSYYGFKCDNLCELNDMDKIHIGDTVITAILTPGHTAGGMCYKLEDCVFTGDTIFIEGCGMCTSRGASPEDMFNTIQKFKNLVALDSKIYPSHSYGRVPGKTLDYLMGLNIYFQIEDKETFIDFRMRKDQKNLFNFK